MLHVVAAAGHDRKWLLRQLPAAFPPETFTPKERVHSLQFAKLHTHSREASNCGMPYHLCHFPRLATPGYAQIYQLIV